MTDQTETTATEEQTAVVTPLQLSDLLLTVQVIQLASNRGAFRPEEFQEIGGLYDRIVTFLKDSGAIQAAPAATEAAPAEATDAPAE
jgi:hypothetical protein